MFKAQKEEISQGITKYKITCNERVINYKDWIECLKESTAFIEFFIETLKTSKYESYFWEVKPINKNTLNEDFEFVLLESKTLLKIEADYSSFEQYFKKGKEVVSFSNLGGDAQLIVPTQIGESSNYAHLATFVRKAPMAQVIKFWEKVGEELEKLIGEKTKWLSTAGLGVYWLHVRIDSKPKYFRYTNYKEFK